MSLFGAFKKLGSAVVDTALLPVDAARDFVTLGGAITDDDEPALLRRGKKIADELGDAYKETFDK